jgi:23S rRNA (pseudouridine1915-N3)-methyltransferase
LRVAFVCIGRLKAGPERELFDRYFRRLGDSVRGIGIAGVDLKEIEESRARRPEDRREEEAGAILAAASAGSMVALDERGAPLSSVEWAADIGRARDMSRSLYAVLIGGPDGFSQSVRERADRIISFGAMTWPHQLVRAMAGEQLYRAVTILARHPYHRV